MTISQKIPSIQMQVANILWPVSKDLGVSCTCRTLSNIAWFQGNQIQITIG